MSVKEIIKKVLVMLGKYDIIASMNSGDVLIGEQLSEVEGYVECLNLVRNEIASEFIPNVKVEKIKTNNGRVDFSNLSGQVIEILSVKDTFGNNLAFDNFDSYLTTSNLTVEIKYNACPEELSLESEFNTTIPFRVFVYGIIRESYFAQNLYEDANVYEQRFKNALQSLARKKSETVVPRRRWE